MGMGMGMGLVMGMVKNRDDRFNLQQLEFPLHQSWTNCCGSNSRPCKREWWQQSRDRQYSKNCPWHWSHYRLHQGSRRGIYTFISRWVLTIMLTMVMAMMYIPEQHKSGIRRDHTRRQDSAMWGNIRNWNQSKQNAYDDGDGDVSRWARASIVTETNNDREDNDGETWWMIEWWHVNLRKPSIEESQRHHTSKEKHGGNDQNENQIRLDAIFCPSAIQLIGHSDENEYLQ